MEQDAEIELAREAARELFAGEQREAHAVLLDVERRRRAGGRELEPRVVAGQRQLGGLGGERIGAERDRRGARGLFLVELDLRRIDREPALAVRVRPDRLGRRAVLGRIDPRGGLELELGVGALGDAQLQRRLRRRLQRRVDLGRQLVVGCRLALDGLGRQILAVDRMRGRMRRRRRRQRRRRAHVRRLGRQRRLCRGQRACPDLGAHALELFALPREIGGRERGVSAMLEMSAQTGCAEHDGEVLRVGWHRHDLVAETLEQADALVELAVAAQMMGPAGTGDEEGAPEPVADESSGPVN